MSDTPSDPKTQLIDNLKGLHLPAMRSGFEEVARIAQQESQSYERYLLELTEREWQARRENRIYNMTIRNDYESVAPAYQNLTVNGVAGSVPDPRVKAKQPSPPSGQITTKVLRSPQPLIPIVYSARSIP